LKEDPLSLDELQLFKRRDILIKAGLAVPFGGILWRLWDLQVKQGDKYKELAKGNRIRLKSSAAPRGVIYDNEGVILATNIPSFNLMLIPEDANDIKAVLQKLSGTLNIPIDLMERALKSKNKAAKYQPILIYKDLTWYQMALVSAYNEEFVGIEIEASPRRYFPLLQTAAHVIGYMNQINKKQLKELPDTKLMSARVIGQDGVERIYNDQLVGLDGGEQVEVDSSGRVIQRMESIDPKPGNDLSLNIDSRLQQKIEQIMGENLGSAIVMNPDNGAVKAMLSLPAYDPNLFSQGLSEEQWSQLINDEDHVLHNKCIQGLYSPGSTFKMAVAAAGLEAGVIDQHTEHVCEGEYKLGRLKVHCWNRSGHGRLNVTGAIENSCNIFFYKVGIELGVDRINEYVSRFGLGKPTGIDLPHEKVGTIPSRAWKQARFKEQWFGGETLPVSIGQGYVTTTPMQLLTYINVIANGGYLVQPHLSKDIAPNRNRVNISENTIKILRHAMFKNVHGRSGTGQASRSLLYQSGGKTGTTQVVSHKTTARLHAEGGALDKRFFHHAWFVGFAPFDNPKISAVLLIENGKAGRNAAVLMKQIFEYYFTEIDPLPTNPDPSGPLLKPV